MSNFSSLSASMRNALCINYGVVFLWITSLVIKKWISTITLRKLEKGIRSIWKVSPITHCYIITALSKTMPLIVNLEQRFINCIVKNLNNPVVSIVSTIVSTEQYECHHQM